MNGHIFTIGKYGGFICINNFYIYFQNYSTYMNCRITVVYAVGGIFVLFTVTLSQILQGEASVVDTADTIRDVDFNSPLDNNNNNNTYNLGTPFLVQYDNNTGIQPPKSANYDFETSFAGFGILNGTRYIDNGAASTDLRGMDGSIVYQNGTVAITTETGEKGTATFKAVGQRNSTSGIVFDHGIIFFTTNSTTGELASLNNTVYVYKDKIDERRGNLTTIAWEWK